MRTLLFALSLILLTGCKQSEKQDQVADTTAQVETIYYLVRHAEKDRTDPENKDPELTPQGLLRADNWAAHFKNIPLDAIYSSDYKRTRQTATPTAVQKDLALTIYQAGKLYNETFLNDTSGKQILVVGHSNTIPKLVNQLIGKEQYADMDDTDNASLFVVYLDKNGTAVERKSIDLP